MAASRVSSSITTSGQARTRAIYLFCFFLRITSYVILSPSTSLYTEAHSNYIAKPGTFHERAKVVDSLPGYTLGIVGCRHNLAPRAQRSRRRSFSADGTIRPLWSPCVGGSALQRLSVL